MFSTSLFNFQRFHKPRLFCTLSNRVIFASFVSFKLTCSPFMVVFLPLWFTDSVHFTVTCLTPAGTEGLVPRKDTNLFLAKYFRLLSVLPQPTYQLTVFPLGDTTCLV